MYIDSSCKQQAYDHYKVYDKQGRIREFEQKPMVVAIRGRVDQLQYIVCIV